MRILGVSHHSLAHGAVVDRVLHIVVPGDHQKSKILFELPCRRRNVVNHGDVNQDILAIVSFRCIDTNNPLDQEVLDADFVPQLSGLLHSVAASFPLADFH